VGSAKLKLEEDRALNAAELDVLTELLSMDFAGAIGLRVQLPHVRVVGRCDGGCATVDLHVVCPAPRPRHRPDTIWVDSRMLAWVRLALSGFASPLQVRSSGIPQGRPSAWRGTLSVRRSRCGGRCEDGVDGEALGNGAVVSWDVFAFIPPPEARSLGDVPHGYKPPALGPRSEVIERIRAVAPHVDSSDPSWLTLVGPDHIIEIGLGDEPIGIMFFVRRGEGCVPLILAISAALGTVPFDCSTGELMSAESGAASLTIWEKYRDQVMGGS
jgi:hypothetical protein